MPWEQFWIVFIACATCQLAFRVLPVIAFSGRSMPALLVEALAYIPVAAFAALVANDLFSPAAIAAGPVQTFVPLVAALPVVICAVKTRSLALCVVMGVVAYGILAYLFL